MAKDLDIPVYIPKISAHEKIQNGFKTIYIQISFSGIK